MPAQTQQSLLTFDLGEPLISIFDRHMMASIPTSIPAAACLPGGCKLTERRIACAFANGLQMSGRLRRSSRTSPGLVGTRETPYNIGVCRGPPSGVYIGRGTENPRVGGSSPPPGTTESASRIMLLVRPMRCSTSAVRSGSQRPRVGLGRPFVGQGLTGGRA
jgi:hypothetical protein